MYLVHVYVHNYYNTVCDAKTLIRKLVRYQWWSYLQDKALALSEWHSEQQFLVYQIQCTLIFITTMLQTCFQVHLSSRYRSCVWCSYSEIPVHCDAWKYKVGKWFKGFSAWLWWWCILEDLSKQHRWDLHATSTPRYSTEVGVGVQVWECQFHLNNEFFANEW